MEGLRPRPPAFRQQAAADRLTAEMGNFFHPKLLLWRPGSSSLGSWDSIWVILGSRGGHTEAKMSVFICFRWHAENSLGHALGTISLCSVIWGCKMGDSIQVHVFGDPGMEVMPAHVLEQ